MTKIPFVAYYRVSTQDQGKSGLGLSAQRESVRDYISKNGYLVAEFEDIESGASDTRMGIEQAIEACVEKDAVLVVKEISRISRDGFKTMTRLEEAGVTFIESTAPFDPSMVKGIKFIMAKQERESIAERTSQALQQIKKKIEEEGEHISKSGRKITGLGSPENLTEEAREKGVEARKQLAYHHPDNRKAGALILALRDSGKSWYYIAKKLNASGFKTRRGCKFSDVQVKRLYERYKDKEE